MPHKFSLISYSLHYSTTFVYSFYNIILKNLSAVKQKDNFVI